MTDDEQYCVKRDCLHCGAQFIVRTANNKFCSTKCCHRKMQQQYRKRKLRADRRLQAAVGEYDVYRKG